MKQRLTLGHVRVYRAIYGAVLNTAHGHPQWGLDSKIARSIAKRATGTLTANWLDVLAAQGSVLSKTGGAVPTSLRWPPPTGGASRFGGEGRRYNGRRPSIKPVIRELSKMAGDARRAGRHERLEAIIEALKLIDKHK